MKHWLLAAIAAVSSAMVGSVDAAVTTTSYAFTNNFVLGPYSSLSGTFTVAHDDVLSSYSLISLNYDVGGNVFTEANSSLIWWDDGEGHDQIILYGNLNGLTVYAHTIDFDFIFTPGLPGASSVYSTGSTFVIPANDTVIEVAGGVPEPASWLMMIGGFGAIGLAKRRRPAALRAA